MYRNSNLLAEGYALPNHIIVIVIGEGSFQSMKEVHSNVDNHRGSSVSQVVLMAGI